MEMGTEASALQRCRGIYKGTGAVGTGGSAEHDPGVLIKKPPCSFAITHWINQFELGINQFELAVNRDSG